MFKKYRRKQIVELRPVTQQDIDLYKLRCGNRDISKYASLCYEDENHITITISTEDINNGSPKLGDMISRNPKNHKDQRVIVEKYFNDNFEEI